MLFTSFAANAQVSPRYKANNSFFNDSLSKRRLKTVIQFELENGGMLYRKGVKENLGNVYYNGFNIKIGWQTERGGDYYHQLYNYPIYGVGFYSSTFRNAELGTPNAIYGFVAVPMLSNLSKRWNYNYRISLGLAGNFNPYDEEDNPFNVLLGTSRNVFIDFGLQANYKLNRHLQVGAGAALHHFSNGSIRKPNKGVNLIPITVALTYTPDSREVDFSKIELPSIENKWQYHLSTSFGNKQIDEYEKRYFKSTLTSYISYPLGHKWRLGLGADLFYTQPGERIERAERNVNYKDSRFTYGMGFYIDHVFSQKLYLNSTVAHYLHRNPYNGEEKPVYLRTGIRYKAYKNAFIGVSIKAHKEKADFTEWTLGYTFKRK